MKFQLIRTDFIRFTRIAIKFFQGVLKIYIVSIKNNRLDLIIGF